MLKYRKLISIFKTASLCRNFEKETYKKIEKKIIKFPVYLSAGQEFIASTLANIMNEKKIKPMIFAQHRCHSTYLSFGGSIIKLIDELLGKRTGASYGMGGSASLHCEKINMYGHDGHMGTQGPIGVGACFVTKKPTVIFLGDASAEDYVLGALGWASTKKLPILFVVEDNNLSILTKKKLEEIEMSDVAKSFKMDGYQINDNPSNIYNQKNKFLKNPCC